eukprot:scaffold89984_cov66-Phaeocystis_antarctica.AAC.2
MSTFHSTIGVGRKKPRLTHLATLLQGQHRRGRVLEHIQPGVGNARVAHHDEPVPERALERLGGHAISLHCGYTVGVAPMLASLDASQGGMKARR